MSPKDRYDLIWKYLDDDKAEDIISYDLKDKCHIADYMIIATGRSSTHLKALGDNLQKKLALKGIKDLRFEGKSMGDWIIVDVGDVIVHLFRSEVREFYDLDKLWEDCAFDGELSALNIALPSKKSHIDGARL